MQANDLNSNACKNDREKLTACWKIYAANNSRGDAIFTSPFYIEPSVRFRCYFGISNLRPCFCYLYFVGVF